MKYLLILIFIVTNSFSFEYNEKYSLLKKENNIYFEYIKDLIKEKKVSQEQIKEILNSKERTVKSNMLKALDFDFNKNKIEDAAKYYEEIILKVSNKIKNSTEAIYIADYLVRTYKYDIIKELLTIEYCESLLDENKESKCLYYLYFANKNNVFSKEKILLQQKYPKKWELLK